MALKERYLQVKWAVSQVSPVAYYWICDTIIEKSVLMYLWCVHNTDHQLVREVKVGGRHHFRRHTGTAIVKDGISPIFNVDLLIIIKVPFLFMMGRYLKGVKDNLQATYLEYRCDIEGI